MNALQARYTSCRSGLTGRPGFQMRSCSSGIAAGDLAAIEARNSYRPPLDAPAAPSAGQLARDFPVALRSYRLPSGALAISRTVYSGRDYSGRWGNFFAHTLVLEPEGEGLPPGWPIDYLDWNGWVGCLPPEEDGEEPPEPLPAVDLELADFGASFGWPALSAFLGREPGREKLLAAMLESLLRGLAERRPVVVKAGPADLPLWIGCLQKLLPRATAWEIAISTYEDDPRQSVALTGTSGQTYYLFDESASRQRFFGFDLVGGGRGEGGEAGRPAATLASWLRHQPASLERYFGWLDGLPALGLEELGPSLDLYRLLHGERDALELDTTGLLALAARRPLADPREVLDAFFALDGLPAIATRDSDKVVQSLLALAAAAGSRRIWREPLASPFFLATAQLAGGKEKMMALVGRDGHDLCDLLGLLGRDGSAADRALGRALGAAIETWPEAPAVREVFEEAGAWEILFGEWLGRLETCADAGERGAAFADYAGGVLARLPRFREAALPWISWTLLARASPQEFFPALRGWLAGGGLQGFPPDLFRQCVDRATEELPLGPPGAELDEVALLLSELARERQLHFSPDRARLRLALRPGSSTHLGKLQLDELFGALEGLGEEESGEFLRRFLAGALRAVDKEVHEKLMAALDRPAIQPVVPDAYAAALRELDDAALFRLARFWIQAKAAGGLARRIGEVAEDFLIDWLAGHPAELEEAKARFPRLRDSGAGWPRWLKRIEKRRRNPLFRVRGWANGVFGKISARRQ